MNKSYQRPYIQHIIMQHAAALLQGSPKGRFSEYGPSGGWDAGGANSRQGGWDDEE